MSCNGSITVMWTLDVFINDFTLTCRRVKTQFCPSNESPTCP